MTAHPARPKGSSPNAVLKAVLALGLCLTAADGALAKSSDVHTHRGRPVPAKPAKTTLGDTDQADYIVVKFQEGTQIRSRGGRLVAQLDRLSAKERARRQRLSIDDATIVSQLEEVNQLVTGPSRHHLNPLFTRPEADLEREKEEGEVATDEELADLNLYYRIEVDGADRKHAEGLIDDLNRLDVVEIAYAEPEPTSAAADLAPTTGNYVSYQGYLGAAPTGIDADYARSRYGARGAGVKVIDIEKDWVLDHEDLNPPFHQSGYQSAVANDRQHGASVLGELAAQENAYGMTGIAPQVATGVSSVLKYTCGWRYANFDRYYSCYTYTDVPDAINRAVGALAAGDIILLEQQVPGPVSGMTCVCNCEQFENLPLEYWQATFDAIRNATARGIIVVEAAGNGSMNLDSSIYGGLFSRTVRDSGAIMVGAGTSYGGRAPECWTNYGNRVDLQGWGDSVATLGWGDLIKVGGTDQRQWYTYTFSGTSSASPMVTGAAAVINGYRKSTYRAPLDATVMRDVLRRTGTPQVGGLAACVFSGSCKFIGPQPNIRAAIEAHEGWCTSSNSITPTTLSQSVSGFIAPNGFRDYCFWTQAGTFYSFTTCGLASWDTILDVRSNYGIYGAGDPLVSVDDSCGLQSSLGWRAPTSGPYLLRVRGYSSSYGPYSFQFRSS